MKLQLANHLDVADAQRGMIQESAIRRVEIDGLVDSGATRLVLPTKIAEQLGLPRTGKVTVKYADQRREERDVVGEVDLTLLGRNSVFTATLEPARETALIGAFVMEELDLLVDCLKGTLRPRDPAGVVNEIE